MGSVCSSCARVIFGDKRQGYQEIPSIDVDSLNNNRYNDNNNSNNCNNSNYNNSKNGHYSLKDEDVIAAVSVPIPVDSSSAIGTNSDRSAPATGQNHSQGGKKKVGFADVGQGLSMYSAYAPKQNEEKSFYLKYSLGEEIGSGSTSKCFKCTRKVDNKAFAVKIIDKKNSNINIKQCLVEIRILSRIKHPNIVDLIDHFETIDNIYMVLELLEGGELFDYVVEKGTLLEEEAKSIAKCIISAVAILHSNNIMHRDLKPENILLTKKGAGAEAKLIDFGLSKEIEENVSSTFLGTKGYLAPEMLQRHQYDKAIDVWALGTLVFVLLCGCLPFSDEIKEVHSDKEIKKNFELRIPHWASDISAPAKDFMHTLLEIDPKKRISAEQSLQHHWFNGNRQLHKNVALQSPKILRRDFKTSATVTSNLMSHALKGFDSSVGPQTQQTQQGDVFSSSNYYNNSVGGGGGGATSTTNSAAHQQQRQNNYSIKSQRALQDKFQEDNLSTSF